MRRARIALGTATQCTRRNDSPPPPPPPLSFSAAGLLLLATPAWAGVPPAFAEAAGAVAFAVAAAGAAAAVVPVAPTPLPFPRPRPWPGVTSLRAGLLLDGVADDEGGGRGACRAPGPTPVSWDVDDDDDGGARGAAPPLPAAAAFLVCSRACFRILARSAPLLAAAPPRPPAVATVPAVPLRPALPPLARAACCVPTAGKLLSPPDEVGAGAGAGAAADSRGVPCAFTRASGGLREEEEEEGEAAVVAAAAWVALPRPARLLTSRPALMAARDMPCRSLSSSSSLLLESCRLRCIWLALPGAPHQRSHASTPRHTR
jgi:hypothetical protein